MRGYDTVRTQPLTDRERRTAAGAAAWILAFNARRQVGLIEHGLSDEATVCLPLATTQVRTSASSLSSRNRRTARDAAGPSGV
jgi:hypothetical protein